MKLEEFYTKLEVFYTKLIAVLSFRRCYCILTFTFKAKDIIMENDETSSEF